jgi:hypothetical protein
MATALASRQQPAVPAAAAPMIVVAGPGTAGFTDGRGAEARFNKPGSSGSGRIIDPGLNR